MLQNYFEQIYSIAVERKPHLLAVLVNRLVAVWCAVPLLCIPYLESGAMQRLVLYKEPRLDDHNVASAEDPALSSLSLPTRIFVLQFLESLGTYTRNSLLATSNNDDVLATLLPHLRNLVLNLMNLNLQKEICTAAVVGTEMFGVKLRCWQALCVLAGCDEILTPELIQKLAPVFFVVLGHSCVNAIRVPMEAWAAMATLQHPRKHIDIFGI